MTEVTISHLAHLGDGVFSHDGRQHHLAFALPGEKLRIALQGKKPVLEEILEPSEQRITPVCPHFGKCGGCQMQHTAPSLYKEWKQGLVKHALERAGIDKELDDWVEFPIASRRKAVFSANRLDGKLQLGFVRAGSHDIVDLQSCPLQVLPLQNGLTEIHEIAKSLPLGKNPIRIAVLVTENGLDVCIEEIHKLSSDHIKLLIRRSGELGLARLALGEDILVERAKPLLKMGIAEVVPAPASFVQAVEACELAMAELACNHLSDCKQVADLFCGIGTFALRLAKNSQVWALEESGSAVASLDRAWRETAGSLKTVRAEKRNLERQPVSFSELKKFDGAVIDPPRAGAEMQMRQLAKSRVRKIVSVSCNPTTMARDLKILMDSGFQLKKLIALDQFQYSPHIECVGILEK